MLIVVVVVVVAVDSYYTIVFVVALQNYYFVGVGVSNTSRQAVAVGQIDSKVGYNLLGNYYSFVAHKEYLVGIVDFVVSATRDVLVCLIVVVLVVGFAYELLTL